MKKPERPKIRLIKDDDGLLNFLLLPLSFLAWGLFVFIVLQTIGF